MLKKFPDRRYLVVGHTDNQDFAKPKAGLPAVATCAPTDNWQLSTERALTVTRVLVTAGMDPKNLIPAGDGDHDPVASNANADGRAEEPPDRDRAAPRDQRAAAAAGVARRGRRAAREVVTGSASP